MRWLAISALLFMAPAPAIAATQINGCGKFEVWVPDNWKVAVDGERLTGESDDLSVLVGPLADKDADLIDEEVTDFIDEELENMKVTSDRREKLESFDVRLFEGTGRDDEEEEDVVFRALALSPNTDNPVIEVLVYGAPELMSKPENQAVTERILRSLRPH
jgi:hypothetical protein